MEIDEQGTQEFREILEHPDTTLDALERMNDNLDLTRNVEELVQVWSLIVRHPHVSWELQLKALLDARQTPHADWEDVATGIAMNDASTREALDYLVDVSELIQKNGANYYIVNRDDVDPLLMERIVQLPFTSETILSLVASNTKANSSTLHYLASRSARIRHFVAVHENTSDETLRLLASDPKRRVRRIANTHLQARSS